LELLKGRKEIGGFAGYYHFVDLDSSIAGARKESFAPSEHAIFMTDTQGSAKPPPWVESGTRFAVRPTGFWAESL
jgi:hypothetical protein